MADQCGSSDTAISSKKNYDCCAREQIAVVVFLTFQAILLAYQASRTSPTVDEPGHLVAGISYWEYGRFEIYRVNPPLVRMFAVLPVWLSGVEVDWKNFYDVPGSRPEFPMGEDFLELHGENSFEIFTIARWAVIPLVLAGGWICFLWACELYGKRAGFLALLLWVVSPNVLGHGSLITSDIPAASMAVASAYTFWRWLREPSWPSALIAGFVLAAAQLTKMSLLMLYFVWPVLWFYQFLTNRTDHRKQPVSTKKQGIQLMIQMLFSLYLLNLGYGFDGTFQRLGDYSFVSETLSGETGSRGANRFRDSWLGSIPVPLPEDFVLGLDTQKSDFEGNRRVFMGGEWKSEGHWYYYLYALALKVPLGVWILFLLTLIVRAIDISSHREDRNETALILPGLALFILISSQSASMGHTRYAFVTLPFLFVWISQVAESRPGKMVLSTWTTVAVAIAAAWITISSLWYYPYSLSYFNELAGGPLGGPKHLLGTNIDWGQNLIRRKSTQKNLARRDFPLLLGNLG